MWIRKETVAWKILSSSPYLRKQILIAARDHGEESNIGALDLDLDPDAARDHGEESNLIIDSPSCRVLRGPPSPPAGS